MKEWADEKSEDGISLFTGPFRRVDATSYRVLPEATETVSCRKTRKFPVHYTAKCYSVARERRFPGVRPNKWKDLEIARKWH